MDSLENPVEQPAQPETPLEMASEAAPETQAVPEAQAAPEAAPEKTPGDPAYFETLMQRHAQLERQQRQNPASLATETIQGFVAELRTYSESADLEQRQALEAAQRRWAAFLQLRQAMASNRRGGIPVWALMLATAAGMLVISLGITWLLRRDAALAPTPTRISLADLTPTADLTVGEVAVLATPTQGILPSPTPIFQVLPTVTPAPTMEVAPTPTMEVTEPPVPTVAPHGDPSGDVASLAGRQIVSAPPPGVDSTSCNIGGDTLVLRDAQAPFTVSTAGNEARLTIWLTLAEPAPAQRTLTYHWILALDVDGNAGTGRPRGAGYINPDLGTEIGAGVFLYPDGRTEPYLYIWDSAAGDWASGARVPDVLEVTFTESRDAVAFSLALADLSTAIQSIAGVTLDMAQLKGRIGTIASSDTVAAVVDFCPDLP